MICQHSILIRKDCLYCDPIDSHKRKSVITILQILLNSLLRWFAPILSFTTEEIFKLISKDKKSVHLEKFIKFPKKFNNPDLFFKWNKLIKIRDICNLSIEEKRVTKIIGSSLEASLTIKLNKEDLDLVKDIDLKELCIVSSVLLEEIKKEQIIVETNKAIGEKCPVCWKISPTKCERHP